jgi:RNA 2',3'-cyclic 3'-phosphodiesterase
MPRYFLAIPLPDEAKQALAAVEAPATGGVRVVGRTDIHLTLHFLGELSQQARDAACKALAEIRSSSFEVSIRGVGRFPAAGDAEVLWAGVETDPLLLKLHRSIGEALANAIGFQVEARPYLPHITLARLTAPPPRVVENYLARYGGFTMPPFNFEGFSLYSSEFQEGLPPVYREERHFPLGE